MNITVHLMHLSVCAVMFALSYVSVQIVHLTTNILFSMSNYYKHLCKHLISYMMYHPVCDFIVQ